MALYGRNVGAQFRSLIGANDRQPILVTIMLLQQSNNRPRTNTESLVLFRCWIRVEFAYNDQSINLCPVLVQ